MGTINIMAVQWPHSLGMTVCWEDESTMTQSKAIVVSSLACQRRRCKQHGLCDLPGSPLSRPDHVCVVCVTVGLRMEGRNGGSLVGWLVGRWQFGSG